MLEYMYIVRVGSMKVLIVDKLRISKYFIQENMNDSFVITYKTCDTKEQVLITFDILEQKKIIKSNGTVNIYSNGQIVPEAALVEYGIYVLKILGSNEYVYMYLYPDIENNMYNLDLSTLSEIKIGNSQECNIIHKNASTGKVHAVIRYINGKHRIESDDNSIYVNNKRVKHSFLKIGDIIFINGIKIVYMSKFLTINNPRNTVSIVGLNMYVDKNALSNNYDPVTDEDKVIELYKEDEYFYHTPRLREIQEEESVSIDSPPGSFIEEELPFWLSLGSSITMLASTFMMGYNVFIGLSSGSKTIMNVLPQIIMCGAMIIGSLILPRISKNFQKKRRLKKETLRKEKYTEYLNKKETEIKSIIKKQEQILNSNSISLQECVDTVNNKSGNFWARQIIDDDFLSVRVGIGTKEPKLVINAPEQHFELETDCLLQNVYDMVSKYKNIENVPINYSFLENNISAIVGSFANKENYIKNIILQLITLHSPQDLKIVIFTNEYNKSKWEKYRFLPHLFSEDKKTRFYATTEEEMKNISNVLEEELKNRKEVLNNDASSDQESSKKQYHKKFDNYYLIINDDYRKSKNINIINNIVKEKDNYGFSFVVIEDSMKYLPKECKNFIQITEKDGCILDTNLSSKTQKNFRCEYIENLDIMDVCHKLSNVPVMGKEGDSVLPQSLTFLDMYGVSKIEQLNISNRWKNNNPVNSLNAIIGVHASGEEFKLNLHEKFHGPHGLIAGSTGSSKSEFIITYILSMALSYHPYEVQFVLIDYKGGGLAGAFQNKETGVKIPHLTGTITNLDVSEMNRTLVSIESEIKRRQKVFNKVRDALGESTIDIYKYQRLYREGAVEEPMAHLFIISDEFAELKSQQPEFMAQLISIARIGRSLGVHLILATQKPSGVVNDQIWSNSKFKVCLKVQEKADSMGMLKRPEAASIKEVGRFYLQVGYDDYFDIGQSGWAGAKYVPSDKIIKKIDDNLDFINNTGEVIKSIKDINPVVEQKQEYGDQLTNIVKYIYNLGQKENLNIPNLWLDPIPEEIYIENLKKKYNYKPTPYFINPVIGEYDIPAEQYQDLLNLNLTDAGNTIIFGQPESGKENLLTTIMWSSMIEHTPDEVNFYLIDCGTEALGTFSNMPHVGEIATVSESEKIVGILSMVSDEIERRKELFTEYAGSYKEYIENSGQKLPLIVTIINNYDIFVENFSKIADSIQTFYRDGARYGIIFIISTIATNSMRSRTLQYFNNKVMLQVPNEIDYRTYLNAPKGLFPAKFFGRGLISKDKTAYEFQTAYITLKKDINTLIRNVAKQLASSYTSRARKVPVVPSIVTLSESMKHLKQDFFPVGYDINTKLPHNYMFKENMNLIVSRTIEQNEIDFVNALMKQFKQLNKEVIVLDLAEAYEKDCGAILYNNDFDNSFIKIYNDVVQAKEEKYYIILGAGYLKTKLPKTQEIIKKLFENIKKTKAHFILFDTYESIRTLQTEMWYQKIDKTNGIWLGIGVANQSCLLLNKLSVDDRNLDFEYMAFVIEKGEYSVIKYVIDQEVENEK